MVAWTQLGLHAKPCGILNVFGYYTPLLAMFDHAVEEQVPPRSATDEGNEVLVGRR